MADPRAPLVLDLDQLTEREHGVYDGDSRRVDGVQHRSAGINTPELESRITDYEAGGDAARRRYQELAGSGRYKTVTLGRGDLGRPLSVMMDENGDTIEAQLIREGYAAPFRPENVPASVRQAWDETVDRYAEGDTQLPGHVAQDMERERFVGTYDPRGTASRAWDRGVDQLQAMGGAFLEATGEQFGSDGLKETGREIKERNIEEAAQSLRTVDSWEDVAAADGVLDTLSTAGSYILERGIENAPQFGVDIAVGAAAAATAPFTGGGSLAAYGAGTVARQALMAQVRRRFVQGAMTAMYPQMVGESYMGMQGNGVADDDAAATALFVTGPVNAALEKVGLDRVLAAARIGGPGAVTRVRDILTEATKAAGIAAPTEGLTEVAQSITTELATIAHKPDHEIDRSELLEAFFSGMAAGGGTATVARGASATAEYFGAGDTRQFTPEPEQDVRAQADDLADPNNPREAVITHPENAAAVADQLEQAGFDYEQRTDTAGNVATTSRGADIETGDNVANAESLNYTDDLDTAIAEGSTGGFQVRRADGAVRHSEAVVPGREAEVEAKLRAQYPDSEVVPVTAEQEQARRAERIAQEQADQTVAAVRGIFASGEPVSLRQIRAQLGEAIGQTLTPRATQAFMQQLADSGVVERVSPGVYRGILPDPAQAQTQTQTQAQTQVQTPAEVQPQATAGDMDDLIADSRRSGDGFDPNRRQYLRPSRETEDLPGDVDAAARDMLTRMQRNVRALTQRAGTDPNALIRGVADEVLAAANFTRLHGDERVFAFAEQLVQALRGMGGDAQRTADSLATALSEAARGGDVPTLDGLLAAVGQGERERASVARTAGMRGVLERSGPPEQGAVDHNFDEIEDGDPIEAPFETAVEAVSHRSGWVVMYDRKKGRHYASIKNADLDTAKGKDRNNIKPFTVNDDGVLEARYEGRALRTWTIDELIADLEDDKYRYELGDYAKIEGEWRVFMYAYPRDTEGDSAYDARNDTRREISRLFDSLLRGEKVDGRKAVTRPLKDGKLTREDREHGRNVVIQVDGTPRALNIGWLVQRIMPLTAQLNAYPLQGKRQVYDATVQVLQRLYAGGYVAPTTPVKGALLPPRAFVEFDDGTRVSIREVFEQFSVAGGYDPSVKWRKNAALALSEARQSLDGFTELDSVQAYENSADGIDVLLESLEDEENQARLDYDTAKVRLIQDFWLMIGRVDAPREADEVTVNGAGGADQVRSLSALEEDMSGRRIEYSATRLPDSQFEAAHPVDEYVAAAERNASRGTRRTVRAFTDSLASHARVAMAILDEIGLSDRAGVTLMRRSDLTRAVDEGLLPADVAAAATGNQASVVYAGPGEYIIVLDSSEGGLPRDLWQLTHELGHIVYDHTIDADRTALERVHLRSGSALPLEEWFAEEYSKRYVGGQSSRATHRPEASRLLDRVFKRLRDKLKALYAAARKQFRLSDFEPNKSVEQIIDGFVAARRYRSPQQLRSPSTVRAFTTVEGVQPRRLTAAIRKVVESIRKGATVFSPIVATADRRLRGISPRIADLFYHQSQSVGGERVTWFQGVNETRARWLNSLTKIVDSDFNEADAVEDMRRMQRGEPPQTAAGRQLRGFLNRFHRYVSQHVKGLGFVLNYFPRVYAIDEIRDRPAEMMAILQRFGVENPGVVIQKLLDDGDLRRAVGPGAGSAHRRQLNIEGLDAALVEAGFTYSNPQQILEHYVMSMVKHAEYDRVVGGYMPASRAVAERVASDHRLSLSEAIERGLVIHSAGARGGSYAIYDRNAKLKRIFSQEQLTQEQQREVLETLDAYSGRLGMEMDPRLRKATSWAVVAQTYLTLAYSTIASIPDLATSVLRAKDFEGARIALSAYFRAIKGYKAHLERARTIGYVNRRLANQAFLEQFGANHLTSGAQKAMDLFFKYNLQESWTQFTRVLSGAVAEDFLQVHAEKAAQGNARSARYLAELGVDASTVLRWKANGLQLWTPNRPHTDDKAVLAQFDRDMEDALAVQSAVSRFVDESIVRPNAAMRPRWASDPRFMLLWHLKSFFYAFGKVVVGGLAREMKARYREGAGIASLAPLALFGMFMLPLAGMALELRELIQYGGEEDPTERMGWADYMGELVSRTGAYGPLEMAFGALNAEQYGSSAFAGLAGPAFQHAEVLLFGNTDYKISRSLPIVNQTPWLRDGLGL
jgi:hypothetical protein